MNLFIKKIFIFVFAPISLLFLFLIVWDPFKAFYYYSDKYDNSLVTLNREHVALEIFKHKHKETKYNSFIIGSSRSHAFKISDWHKFGFNNDTSFHGFHFDGSDLGLFRMRNIIKYLDEETDQIKNLLLIIDNSTFNEYENPKIHLFIQPSDISKTSALDYYFTYIRASMNPKFIFVNIDYFFTKEKKSYMYNFFIRSKYFNYTNINTGDVYYGYDLEIERDSVHYYNQLISKGVFFKRDTNALFQPVNDNILKQQISRLKDIKDVVDLNNSNLKIVISPLYDQNKFNKKYKKILFSIFGKECIYDFSGVNSFTENYTNFYESSHYRPHVAREILRKVYSSE